MNGITNGIGEFYRQIFGDTTVCGRECKIFPLKRIQFNTGAIFAIGCLVQKVVESIFYLLLNLATFGQNQSFRNSFSIKIREGFTYTGAIPVGFIGVLFPQTINRHILGIPDGGLLIDLNQLNNPLIASIKKENLLPSPIIISEEVKQVLNELFEGSGFSVDSLPVYSYPLNNRDSKPDKDLMRSPVMKGITTDDRRPFIAIKLCHTLTDQEIDDLDDIDTVKTRLRDHRENSWLITLNQKYPDGVRIAESDIDGFGYSKNLWSAVQSGPFITPDFFTDNITFSDTGELVESQREGFELLKTVLRTGQGVDLKGCEWRLPAETNS